MWHRITLEGTTLESALEQARMMDKMAKAIMKQNLSCYRMAQALMPSRLRWKRVPVHVRSHDDRRGRIVWHMNDGALDVYLSVGGQREIEYSLPYVPESQLGGHLIHHKMYVPA